MANVSYSKLILYDQCPAAWEARYLRRIPEQPGHPMEAGRGLAKFAEYYRRYLQQRQLDQDQLAVDEIVRAVFIEADVALEKREVETTAVFKDVIWMARQFARRYRHDFEATLGIEKFFSRNLVPAAQDSPGVDVIGFADYVRLYEDKETKGPIILFEDEKTSWDPTVTSAHDFQLDIYDWMGEAQYQDYRVGSRINFVRYGVSSKIRILAPRDLDVTQQRISTVHARMAQAQQARHFPAHPGDACAYCVIATACAKRGALVKSEQLVADQASAEECLADMLVLEAALNQREKQLKAYAKAHGPVQVGGKVAGYGAKRSVVLRDAQALYDRLGPAAFAYLSVDNRKGKKLQNDPNLLDLFVEERSSKFEIGSRAIEPLPVPAPASGDTEE